MNYTDITPFLHQSGGQPGNQNAKKFKTEEELQHVFEEYIKHVEEGYSDESFPLCEPQTLKKYIEADKQKLVFDTERISQAKRNRRMFWERIGIVGTVGKLKGFNPKSWEFNMKNRFNWKDRQDVTTNDEKIEHTVIYKPAKRDE